jgi:hypothetical protein
LFGFALFLFLQVRLISSIGFGSATDKQAQRYLETLHRFGRGYDRRKFRRFKHLGLENLI